MALAEILSTYIPGRSDYVAREQQNFNRNIAGLGALLRMESERRQQEQMAMEQQMQPLRMDALRAQIERQNQEVQMKRDFDQRQQAALAGLGDAFGRMYPGAPAQMDAADNVMAPAKQDPRAEILRHSLALDPRDAARVAMATVGLGGSNGGRGVDPLIQRNAEFAERSRRLANDAERAGDAEGAARHRRNADAAEAAIAFEAGKADRFGRVEDRRDSELYDRTGRMPARAPVATPSVQQGQVSFPSNGYNPSPTPTTDALMADAGTNRDMSRQDSLPGAASHRDMTQAPALAPKDARGVSAANIKEANENFVNKEFRPTQEAANVARSMKGQIDAFRSLPISAKTGWGTEAKAYAARVLAAIPGMDQTKISEYAANAEQFNSLMFRQNWELLVQQKGVQTEGDAQRAQKVFAQLGNRPEANEFIWDFAKAVNDASLRKAKFYTDNYPGAVRSGNVYELESQWAERNKDYSIWNEPSMKKWQNTGRRARRTGTLNGRRVVEYDDGTVDYQ